MQELTAQWEFERQLLDRAHRLKEEVERVRLEIAAAERAYDLERAARLMYDTLPGLQGKLVEAEEELKGQVCEALKGFSEKFRLVSWFVCHVWLVAWAAEEAGGS